MSEQKYKVKFRDFNGNFRYTKSFDDEEFAKFAMLVLNLTLSAVRPLMDNYSSDTQIVEICPNCETENINTDGGDCYCAECGYKWTY